MHRTLLSGKIHRARVTAADLAYEGSLSLDEKLMAAAGIVAHERVQVVDVDNGARLETYVIPAPGGSGTVQLNGAAAHLVNVGDHVIIMSYAQVAENAAHHWHPTVVMVDDANRPVEIRRVSGEPSPAC